LQAVQLKVALRGNDILSIAGLFLPEFIITGNRD